MYETYRYIFFGGLTLSLVFLAVTVFLFFFFDIRNSIGDITGTNKRKALEKSEKRKQRKKKEMKKPAPLPKVQPAQNTSAQLTSRMSIQDRYNAMDGGDQTSLLNRKNKQSPPSENKNPHGQNRRQSANAYKPVAIVDSGFVLEADITFVHSGEVIE